MTCVSESIVYSFDFGARKATAEARRPASCPATYLDLWRIRRSADNRHISPQPGRVTFVINAMPLRRRGRLQAAFGRRLLPGDPVRGIGHAIHVAASFPRGAIEALERAIRQRKRAAVGGRLLGHIAQVLTHRVDIEGGRT